MTQLSADASGSHFGPRFDDNFDDIWSYARRRCRSRAHADDVAAETFAIAWRRRDDIPPGHARLWLLGVARRVLANQRRAADRRDRRGLHRPPRPLRGRQFEMS